MPDSAARPIILALDAAGSACSVVVAAGDRVIAEERRAMVHGHAEALLPMVDAAMRKAALPPASLDVVATTIGPGGFTGLRVGLAAARGVALATGVPLIGVTGFAAVVAALRDAVTGFLLIAIESRRADLYVQLFDRDRQALADPASVLPEALAGTVDAALGAVPLLIAGDAAGRAAAALAGRALTGVAVGSAPDARGVARAAFASWRLGKPYAAANPFYLRPPDVSLARPAGGRA